MLLVRRIRYGMVALAVVVIAWLLWQARGALIPFLVGGVLALLLSPLVERLARVFPFYSTRRELARTLAIFEVYLLGATLLVWAGALIVPALVDETTRLVNDIPRFAEEAQARLDQWNRLYRDRVPPQVQQRIDQQAARLGEELGTLGREALNRSLGVITSTFSVVLGYIVIPFWLFYVLKDRHKIAPTIRAWFPPTLREDVDECLRIVQRVLGSYVRVQLTLGVYIGAITTAGLFLMGIEFYVVLGLIAGITELIPVLGPILGAIPAIIVTLATDPGKTIWVILFYFAVQQTENAILVPRMHANAVQMHPALIIVLLVVAQQVGGFMGMLVAVPLAAVSKDLFKYIYHRLREREEELAHPAVIRLKRPQAPVSADTLVDGREQRERA
jgi:predicted PurR-regulated permease PerM